MKRKFRARPNRRNSAKFTFHSYGTHFAFDPYRIVEDDRLVNEMNWFERVRMIDLYKDEVRAAKSKHVFILDSNGDEVKV